MSVVLVVVKGGCRLHNPRVSLRMDALIPDLIEWPTLEHACVEGSLAIVVTACEFRADRPALVNATLTLD